MRGPGCYNGPVEPFDCELLRDGLLTQPVNAASALAFVVAASFLWTRGRPDVAAFAAFTGIGAAWFHAAPGGAASWAHDISLYALVALATIELWQRLSQRRLPVPAIAVFLVGLMFWSIGRTGSPFCHPESLLQWHAIWHFFAATAAFLLFTGEALPAHAE